MNMTSGFHFGRKALASLILGLALAPGARADYLFVHFRDGKGTDSEQIYFALSADGNVWREVNGGEPVLRSGLGEKGVRDPFILRSPDGAKFYIVATDLSIARNGDWGRAVTRGSKSLVVWESTDLVNWSAPRLVPVAPPDAGCTWAPEAFYDAKKGDYLVFWASKTGRDKFAKHRIWAARTKEFRAFSAPFIWIEHAADVIDTTVLEEDGRLYRFNKDEKGKTVLLETAPALDGPWTEVPTFTLATMKGYEGPLCYRLPDGSWRLLLDNYARGRGYIPFKAAKLAAGDFREDAGFHAPYKFRHGSVLAITAAEAARIERAWAPRAPAAVPGLNADPTLAKSGGRFWLYPTTDGFAGWGGTSFHCLSSADLKAWKDEGVIFDLPRDCSWAKARAWAPDIEERNGKFYFYFCADGNIGVGVADRPQGPFKDALGKPLVKRGDFQGQVIDPMAFTDPKSGQPWLFWGNGRCYAVPLNDDMVSFDKSQVRDITPRNFREGAFMICRKGVYYLMWSENDTRSPDYCVAYGMSESPAGPFERRGVILKGRGAVKGAGHHSVLEIGPDRWVIAYHRFRIPDGDGFHRETVIGPLAFNPDGTIQPVDVAP